MLIESHTSIKDKRRLFENLDLLILVGHYTVRGNTWSHSEPSR